MQDGYAVRIENAIKELHKANTKSSEKISSDLKALNSTLQELVSVLKKKEN